MANILALGSDIGDVCLYDLNTRLKISLVNLGDRVPFLKFSSDGTFLFAASGDTLYQLLTEDLSKKLTRFGGGGRDIADVYLNWEENRVCACVDRRIKIWDARLPFEPYTTLFNEKELNCIDFLPQKNLVLTGDRNGCVQSWDVRTMTREYTGRASENNSEDKDIYCIAASPDGSWIGAGNANGDFFQFRYENKEFKCYNTHPGGAGDSLMKCIFPRNDRSGFPILAYSGTVARYDTGKGKPVFEKSVDESDEFGLWSCAVSSDGSVIYSGLDDGKVVSYLNDEEIGDSDTVDVPVGMPKSAICALDLLG